ncbi:MAG: hypothetical protein VSS75_014510 [Candidatus Parabeggiatoa sp.]|nr:hypothetical protein [Candidatus Parabeggiatoa sp.]
MKIDTQQEFTKVVMPTSSSTLLKWAKRIFTPLALGFIIYFAWQSRNILATLIANAQPDFLILAVFFLIIVHFVAPASVVMILKACGSSISYSFALKTHINRLPARYLPGGIWHTVGRTMDFYQQGIKPVHLTTFVLLENIMAASTAFIIGGISVWYFRGITDIWGKIAVIGCLCSILGLSLAPKILNWQILKSVSQVHYRFYLQTIAIYILIWFLLTFAFITYLSAFLALGEISMLEVGGIYIFSWGIGFIAIFAPQGIGIFEMVAGNMLNAPLSLGNIAVLLAGFRVITLIADMSIWSLKRLVYLSRFRNH